MLSKTPKTKEQQLWYNTITIYSRIDYPGPDEKSRWWELREQLILLGGFQQVQKFKPDSKQSLMCKQWS